MSWKNFIQWKGTDVCIDVICPECGKDAHFDGDFLYHYQCPHCESVFKMGSEVSMELVANTEGPVQMGHKGESYEE